jgi:hypothetical protein
MKRVVRRVLRNDRIVRFAPESGSSSPWAVIMMTGTSGSMALSP